MRIGMVGPRAHGRQHDKAAHRQGHEVVAHDPNAEAVKAIVEDGAQGCGSLEELGRGPGDATRRVG